MTPLFPKGDGVTGKCMAWVGGSLWCFCNNRQIEDLQVILSFYRLQWFWHCHMQSRQFLASSLSLTAQGPF